MAGSKSSTGAGTVAGTGGVERVEIVTRGEVRRKRPVTAREGVNRWLAPCCG